MQEAAKDITILLSEFSRGNKDIINDIFPIVYNELRKIASGYLYQEYGNRTITTTELVHEVYLKILGAHNVSVESRAHFFGIAANAMRQLLVDYARKRNSEKRGGDQNRVTLAEGFTIITEYDSKIIDIDNALVKLQQLDDRLSKVVELRFFAGLNVEETAAALDCSPATVKREWSLARAWLYKELQE